MSQHPTITPAMTLLLAFACGAIVGNLYYAQPLVALIGPDIGLSDAAASLVVTLSQIGYGLGLVLLVPLGDLLENRRTILVTLSATIAALLMAAMAGNAVQFLAAAWFIGVTSVVVQMLVPLAAHMAPEQKRGQVVGNVMSGLLLGILLARPVASLVADLLGWRAIFFLSAAFMVVLVIILARLLPQRRPNPGPGYGHLLLSLVHLWTSIPVLRRRALYQAALFASFSLFWTGVPLELAGPEFGLSQSGIALFALTGAAGALAAPLSGRMADRGLIRPGTCLALALVAAGFALALLGRHSLIMLVLAGILVDLGVQINLVLGQRTIFILAPDIRSRLNGVFMATFFMGGALGSALASPAFSQWGWAGVSVLGMVFPLIALIYFLTERKAG